MATESQIDSRIQIWLDADVVVDSTHWSAIDDVEASVAAASRAMALHAQFDGSARAVVCISLSSDEVVRDLNRTYRNMDKPTNVLSFPAGNGAYFQREIRPLGDIVLAAETLFREAAELNVSPRHHMQHLVVHGFCIFPDSIMTPTRMPLRWRGWKWKFFLHLALLTLMRANRRKGLCVRGWHE